MALGLWDDVAKANEVAMRVVNLHAGAEGHPPAAWGHYAHRTEYAYFQQGRRGDAGKMLQTCRQLINPSLAWSTATPTVSPRHGPRPPCSRKD
ncbi:hypothetical protein [Rhodanobacter lindaniclasticus]